MSQTTTPEELLAIAQEFIRQRYQKSGHHTVVAAALLTKSGKIFKSLNAGTTQPSIATCAEIIAIGMANTDDPHMQIDLIVAVRDPCAYVISPCGKCREYIVDYGADARVIVPANTEKGWEVVAAKDLIPNKYEKKSCTCS